MALSRRAKSLIRYSKIKKLSPKETAIMVRLVRGERSREVMVALQMKRSTYYTLVERAMIKLGARTRMHAASLFKDYMAAPRVGDASGSDQTT